MLYPGLAPLQLNYLPVQLLSLLVRLGTAALQLQSALAYILYLFPDKLYLIPGLGHLAPLFLQSSGKAIYLSLSGLHRIAAHLTVSRKAVQQQPQLACGVLRGLQLRLQGGRAASQPALFFQSQVQLITHGVQFSVGLLQLLGGELLILFQLLPILFQPFQLVGSGEYAAALGAAAAGHGASGVYHLSVQSDNTQAVSAVSGHAHCVAQSLRHHGAAQKV